MGNFSSKNTCLNCGGTAPSISCTSNECHSTSVDCNPVACTPQACTAVDCNPVACTPQACTAVDCNPVACTPQPCTAVACAPIPSIATNNYWLGEYANLIKTRATNIPFITQINRTATEWTIDGIPSCVGQGANGSACDSSKVFCTGGTNLHGTGPAQMNAIFNAFQTIGKRHPLCPVPAQQAQAMSTPMSYRTPMMLLMLLFLIFFVFK